MIGKGLVYLCTVLFLTTVCGQKESEKELRIPMTSNSWDVESGEVEFTTHRSVPAVKPKGDRGFQIFLKDHIFSNGTIEFDVEIKGMGFPGIAFRTSKEKKQGEILYLRYFGSASPFKRETLQYAAILDGVNMWDMTDEYQAAATIKEEGWNHIKLVVSGKQMKVYVNNMEQAALHVPCLEGELNTGQISLSGNVIYSNFTMRPNVTEDLPQKATYDPTQSDSRYLRNWSVTEPVDFPFERDVAMNMENFMGIKSNSDLPDSTTVWRPIKAERRALINLTRQFGGTKAGERRLTWLKTTISSKKEQKRWVDMGFSDEIWVFINGKPLLTDKNHFGTPGMKYPKGRCTIENTSFPLPLKEGDNELLIGVSNFFYGWGIIARLDDTEGLTLE